MVELGSSGFGATAGAYADSADELGDTFGYNAAIGRSAGTNVGKLTRDMRNPLGGVVQPGLSTLRALGIEVDMNSRIMKAINTTCMLNAGMMSIYSAARATVLTKTAWETTQASILTTANAIVQNWGLIALAGATAAGVAAGLAASGTFDRSGGDLTNPTERRSAIGSMGAAVNGGG